MGKILILIVLECTMLALAMFTVYVLIHAEEKMEKILFATYLALEFVVMVCCAMGIMGI